MQNQPSPRPSTTPQAGNLLFLLINAWALTVQVFLRKGFGSRYIGIQAFFGLAILLTYILFCDVHNGAPVAWFILAYSGMAATQRLAAGCRSLNGDTTHSRYSGWPVILGSQARVSEATVKQYVEPMLVFTIALAVGPFNPPMGYYLFIAGFCLMLSAYESEYRVRLRTMEMNDAVMEQQEIGGRFRELRRNNF